MESKLLVLVFLSSALASEFFVDIENENPLSRFSLELIYFHFSYFSPEPCAAWRLMPRASVPPAAPTRTAPPPAPSGSILRSLKRFYRKVNPRCGILNSVCGTYTCSGVTTSCTTSTSTSASTTAAASTATCTTGGNHVTFLPYMTFFCHRDPCPGRCLPWHQLCITW